MPHYIISGRSEDGRTITQMVKTATAQDALDIMRDRGFVDLVLHTDDITAATLQTYQPNRRISPGELIKQSRLSAVGRLQRVLRRVGAYWSAFVLLFIAAFALFIGVGGGLEPAHAFKWSLFAIAIVIGIMISLGPAVIQWYRGPWRYEQVNRAIALGQWDNALRVSCSVALFPAAEIAFRRAVALAGSGRLDEALDYFDEHCNDQKSPEWLERMRRADIVSFGGNHDEAIACLEEAIRLSPLNPSIMLVLALKRLRRHHDVTAARKLLICARENPIAETIRYLASAVEGLIALYDNDPRRAAELLKRSLQELAPRRPGDPMVGLADAGIRGHLATALARLGERDAADREFHIAEPYLCVHPTCATIVQEYHDAMAGK